MEGLYKICVKREDQVWLKSTVKMKTTKNPWIMKLFPMILMLIKSESEKSHNMVLQEY